MTKEVIIVVIAQGIDQSVVDRFVRFANCSKKNKDFDIHVESGNPNEEKFYKSRLLNKCINKFKNEYKYIIQTDIDLIVPYGLVDRTLKIASGSNANMVHCLLRYIEPEEIQDLEYDKFPWETWVRKERTYCSGCWNGATVEAWKKSGGWNSHMYDWGYEDTEFRERSKRRGIRWKNIYDMPLVHVNHPNRTPRRTRDNKDTIKKFKPRHDFLKEWN
jgi:hypothetical protein